MIEQRAAAPWRAETFTGELIWPDDERYESARRWHSSSVDVKPALIVRCASEADVRLALRFARAHDLPVAVRSGGHGMAGQATADGGVVIDLSLMNQIDIDPDTRTARIGAGARWGQVAEAANEHGLALTSGDVATVGVGGLTVGGGIGWFVRKRGLTIDNLLSARIVTADGESLTASETAHPDLFWALRGGGGNFGVVTSFQFRLYPDAMVVGGVIFFDRSEAASLLSGWADFMKDAPEDLSSMIVLMNLPPAPFVSPDAYFKPAVAVLVCYAGSPEEAVSTVDALRALGTPIAEMVAPMPYKMMFKLTEPAEESGHPHAIRSGFFRELSPTIIERSVASAGTMSSPFGMVQIRALGGQMGRVPADATAFAHRDKRFSIQAINTWQGEDVDGRHAAWVESYWSAVEHLSEGAYVNFLEDEGDERARGAYVPETWTRLAGVKRRYDPDNIFRPTVNIPPAA